MRDIGPLEIALIVGVIVLIFGAGKLGQIGGALGKSIHDFRKERDRNDDDRQPDVTPSNGEMVVISSGSTSATGKVCHNCGNRMSDKAKFCMACGSSL